MPQTDRNERLRELEATWLQSITEGRKDDAEKHREQYLALRDGVDSGTQTSREDRLEKRLRRLADIVGVDASELEEEGDDE